MEVDRLKNRTPITGNAVDILTELAGLIPGLR